MKKIIGGNHSFKREALSADAAREVFAGQVFKQELIDGLDQGGLDEYGNPLEGRVEISTFTVDKFTDLCRGPHVESTKQINPKAIKLMKVAGAYWAGDEHTPFCSALWHGLKNPKNCKNI